MGKTYRRSGVSRDNRWDQKDKESHGKSEAFFHGDMGSVKSGKLGKEALSRQLRGDKKRDLHRVMKGEEIVESTEHDSAVRVNSGYYYDKY